MFKVYLDGALIGLYRTELIALQAVRNRLEISSPKMVKLVDDKGSTLWELEPFVLQALVTGYTVIPHKDKTAFKIEFKHNNKKNELIELFDNSWFAKIKTDLELERVLEVYEHLAAQKVHIVLGKTAVRINYRNHTFDYNLQGNQETVEKIKQAVGQIKAVDLDDFEKQFQDILTK